MGVSLCGCVCSISVKIKLPYRREQDVDWPVSNIILPPVPTHAHNTHTHIHTHTHTYTHTHTVLAEHSPREHSMFHGAGSEVGSHSVPRLRPGAFGRHDNCCHAPEVTLYMYVYL